MTIFSTLLRVLNLKAPTVSRKARVGFKIIRLRNSLTKILKVKLLNKKTYINLTRFYELTI